MRNHVVRVERAAPTENFSGEARVGDENGYVSIAPRADDRWHRMARDVAYLLDQFMNRRSSPGAEIERPVARVAIEDLEGPDVSGSKIHDMDVITDATSVRSGVVVAEHL